MRVSLVLLTAVVLSTLAACRQVDCPQVCGRVKTCQSAVVQAVAARLPTQSRFMQEARRRLPARLGDRLIRSCADRCSFLRKNKRWRRLLLRCQKTTGCDAFARCVAPAFQP